MDAVVTGGRTLSAREEELLGLLACFPDAGEDRELSFSDYVEAAGARPGAHHHAAAPAPATPEDRGATLPPGKQEAEAESKRQKAATARERRQRRQRSGGGSGSSRGSCGGGGDGVLLNFYVPGLLTRSMTAPRPGRAAVAPPAKASAAAAVSTGKPRAQAPLGIGCWPALWSRGGRDRRRTAKVCS